MAGPLRIALVFDSDLAYPRGVLRGIKQFAEARPHWGLVAHDAEGLTTDTLDRIRPDGLIANVTNDKLAALLASQRRPIVNCSPVLPGAAFPRVMVDHREIGRLAYRHLADCGLTHFAFVGHPRHLYSTEREAGFREGLAAAQHFYDRFYERPATSFRRRARLLALSAGMQRWLAALPKPVGIFACHDVWGVQVVEACRLTGLRVPDDVAVIGVDNDDLLCELARPSLSSIVVPAAQVGFEAAALLERLLARGRKPRRPQLIPPGGVVARQSSDILASGDADLAAAVRFIRDRAHLSLSVDDVLQAVPVSRRALEQKFRATLSRGIGQEIRRVNLERAKRLLATTALSVAEVARQAGFTSVHYLSRAFHREEGQTPTAYRAQFHATRPARSR